LAIVGVRTDVVEVGKNRRYLIPKLHRRHHLVDVVGEPNPKLNIYEKRMVPTPLSTGSEATGGAEEGDRGGSGGRVAAAAEGLGGGGLHWETKRVMT